MYKHEKTNKQNKNKKKQNKQKKKKKNQEPSNMAAAGNFVAVNLSHELQLLITGKLWNGESQIIVIFVIIKLPASVSMS